MNIHELLISKTLAMFKPVVWVRVGLETNGTCLFGGPNSGDLEYIFQFLASCAGSEEIVPESTRIMQIIAG